MEDGGDDELDDECFVCVWKICEDVVLIGMYVGCLI